MTQPKFINRELSWLEFNQRVLDQAEDKRTPLLERVRFLSITGSNLDEFFVVRVGGLRLQLESNSGKQGVTGLNAAEQLKEIRDRVVQMTDRQSKCFDNLMQELCEHGICRLREEELTESQGEHLGTVFDEQIASVVSPIAIRDPHDFPAMIGATFGLCLRLAIDKSQLLEAGVSNPDAKERFVVLTVRGLDRIWTLPSEEGFQFVLVEDVLTMFASRFFPGQEILESIAFRTTRNGDVTVDEEAADLLAGMEAMLLQRRTGDCVRLEVDASASDVMIDFMKQCLEISDDQVYRVPGPLDVSQLDALASVSGYRDLKFEPQPACQSPAFPVGENIFDVIAGGDKTLIHPYQDYQPVVDFLVSAANDPNVIAIKQTLYRTSRKSKIVDALRKAADAGKHVTVLLELKARFDEKRNIDWARKLEQAGVDVIYGVRGLKTHAKICLVVRRETSGIRRYVHFGTGNYNETTARFYSDVSYFTCDPEFGTDTVNLFNAITGLSIPQDLNRLVAAPIDLRRKISAMIDVEIASAEKGRPSLIRAKVNSLVDPDFIRHLYRASQAGVKIELNVRGVCCLRPGVKGLSENIRVISIVDRYLEHARIFYFLHGGDHRTFISSADWMPRNLDRRIEVMVPILDRNCAERITRSLQAYFDDNVNAYELDGDGVYHRLTPQGSEMAMRSQQHLYALAHEEAEYANSASRTTFQPHRANNESA